MYSRVHISSDEVSGITIAVVTRALLQLLKKGRFVVTNYDVVAPLGKNFRFQIWYVGCFVG